MDYADRYKSGMRIMARGKPKVLDLFCGAGGIAEGFRQSGFEVVAGVDNWGPAVETFQKNHPHAQARKGDLAEIEPSEFGDIDVVVGGPPCQQFSYSNHGGGGDLELGMRLVLRYLYYVAELKPAYWVIENVPRLLEMLPAEVAYRKLGISRTGSLKIPKRILRNAADYGAPQRRRRLISGNYPEPVQTNFGPIPNASFLDPEKKPWVPMRNVIEGLPDPLSKPARGKVSDPNYGFSLPVDRVTDHFMDTVMTSAEAERNRRQKTSHPYYGKMSFPDNLDRPARTVMATQFNASRETMVIPVGGGRYRKPTIRECASLQGYPLTYQFWGGSDTARYKLVGNSVPVQLARALATAMMKDMGEDSPEPEFDLDFEPAPALPPRPRRSRSRGAALRATRTFVPQSKVGRFRVELDNRTADGPGPWAAKLYVRINDDDVRCLDFQPNVASGLLLGGVPAKVGSAFLEDVSDKVAKLSPARIDDRKVDRFAASIGSLVDGHFEAARWGNSTIELNGLSGKLKTSHMPTRVAASLTAASMWARALNDAQGRS